MLIYEINGPMFFGAIDNFERVLHDTATDPKVLVIRLHRVPFIDATGLQCLEVAVTVLHKRGVRVLFCEANTRVLEKLRKAGSLEVLGLDVYCETLGQAVKTALELR